MIIIAFW